jgi:hypothetical protein
MAVQRALAVDGPPMAAAAAALLATPPPRPYNHRAEVLQWRAAHQHAPFRPSNSLPPHQYVRFRASNSLPPHVRVARAAPPPYLYADAASPLGVAERAPLPDLLYGGCVLGGSATENSVVMDEVPQAIQDFRELASTTAAAAGGGDDADAYSSRVVLIGALDHGDQEKWR